MGHLFSTVTWESPAGGKFRIFSRFYDVYGLGEWKPVEVQERIISSVHFARVGACLVTVELKPNGTHEIGFLKEKQWTAKQVRYLERSLDGLNMPYHWWGLVIIRPHLRLSKEAAMKAAAAKAEASEEAGKAVVVEEKRKTVVEKKEVKIKE
ncbi:hypothetical protein I317_01385 [Kwoniella heveanensis CBS 569]|nr:hypothetical protein I317_01385 [Kwoniella heveanensis CBS 569]